VRFLWCSGLLSGDMDGGIAMAFRIDVVYHGSKRILRIVFCMLGGARSRDYSQGSVS
jgi:hypothetical protein